MRLLIFIVVGLSLSTLAHARPRATEDGSAPRAALLMYDKMVGPNETEKALPLYYAAATRERALAAVLAKCDGAVANLRLRATEKFGAKAADAMLHIVNASTTDDINRAKIAVAGDTAEVLFPEAEAPTLMVRVKGEWKISVKDILQNIKANPRAFRQSMAKVAVVVNQAAEKIQEGQYTSAQDASKQLRKAYRAALSLPAE